MELRQLEYFREIASTGSINEAARHLNMSQPPLSYQIRQLENELNVKLFDRTSKGVTLTEAGKLLYDRSGNLLEYARSTELEVSKTGKKRILRIGLTPTTVDTIMPYISQFSKKNPDLKSTTGSLTRFISIFWTGSSISPLPEHHCVLTRCLIWNCVLSR